VSNSKHILLIAYTFPPYSGIGGRRWAKFAKYLSKLGYTVHVVQAKNPFNEISLWLNDVKNNEHIKCYEIESSYPKALLSTPQSFIDKIRYKVALFKVNLFTKGTPYDKGVFWKSKMLKLSVQLINQSNIKNVIVTSAPFSCAYNALELKSKFKDLNLMVDFRDPWTWGKGYGMSTISNKRKNYEKMMEKNVVEGYHSVFTPVADMCNYLQETYPLHSAKINVLPHGFDTDDIQQIDKINSDKIRLVFFGTLYNELDRVFDQLSSFLLIYKEKITLDIFSDSERYSACFKSNNLLGGNVNYHKQLMPEELFRKFNQFDFALIIQPDFAKDFISTKIYEIIYSKKLILLISKEGELSSFVKQNKLGIHVPTDTIGENLIKLLHLNDSFFKQDVFPIKNYSFEKITSDFTKFIK
jgi:glycosyltransferase involved in cell wall biosynthesis